MSVAFGLGQTEQRAGLRPANENDILVAKPTSCSVGLPANHEFGLIQACLDGPNHYDCPATMYR